MTAESTREDALERLELGKSHYQGGRYENATQELERALALNPKLAEAQLLLGIIQAQTGRLQPGEANLTAVLKESPDSFDALLWLAFIKKAQGNWPEALALCERMTSLRPTDAAGQNTLGTWLQYGGRFDEAAEVFERSTQLRPLQGQAYFGLAESSRFEGLIERMLPLLSRQDLDEESRMYICYALGKSYDHAKVYDKAMQFFDEANARAYAIYNSTRGFDREIIKGYPDKVAGIYHPDKLEGIKELGSSAETPVFIVGMIRSGTTLLDQIITSHPEAKAAGELDYWKLQADRFNRDWFKNGIDPSQIEPMAKSYLKLLDEGPEPVEDPEPVEGAEGVEVGGRAPEQQPARRASINSVEIASPTRITDKMPINYESLGLIHLVFPKAKILHIRRNPLDTCLSIYMTYYGGGPNFAYNQENIIAYYRAYLRFMELWREVIPPENLLEIDYEDLVAKPEPLIRRIVEFCGLPWDSACLHHQGNQNTVATPSTWQARQPIYKTSIERWQRYEPWLGDLAQLKGLQHPPPKEGV